MNKKHLAILLLTAFLAVSCNSGSTVYFFSDKYLQELKTEFNIIEEFEKTAASKKYKLKTILVHSEEILRKQFNSMNTISENDRIIMTSFVFNNYFSGINIPLENEIYIIGPYAGFNRNEITVAGNWESVLEDTGSEIHSGGDFNHIYIYCEMEHRERFPEKEFIQKISGSTDSEGPDNPLSVTLHDPAQPGDHFQVSEISKDLVIVFPGLDSAELINLISGMKDKYILIDYTDISRLDLVSAAGNPVSVIKYDYKGSFEDALSREVDQSDKKIIYISTLEKK